MANFFLDGHSQPPSSPTSPTETKEWDSDALAPGQVVSDYTPAPAFLVPQESEFEGASSLRIVPALLSNRSLFPSEPQSNIEPPAPGICGLDNLGNTCYLNAALQCAVSVPPLCNFFLAEDGGYHELYEAEQKQEQENEEEEAEDGEMDSGTVDGATTAPDQVVPIEPSLTERVSSLTQQYCGIMSMVWSGNHNVVSPAGLHSAFGNVHGQFKNFLQHDSQEFLTFLLNSLHEDLQHHSTRKRESRSIAEPTPRMPSTAESASSDLSYSGVEARWQEPSMDVVWRSSSPSGVPSKEVGGDSFPCSASPHRFSSSSQCTPPKIPCLSSTDNCLPVFSASAVESDSHESDSLVVGAFATVGASGGFGCSEVLASHSNEDTSTVDERDDLVDGIGVEDGGMDLPAKNKTTAPSNVSTIVSDTFEGEFTSQIVCCKCKCASVQREPFFCLSLPISGATEIQTSVYWVPKSGVFRRRFFLTLHKHSSIADLLKVVCGKLCTDYSYAADPDSLVAGTVRNMQLKEVLDQARHVRSVDSSAELHIFELKSPLPPAADDVTAVPLIPGAQLVSGSPLWELPPKKEGGTKQFATAVSDTDSGFTQSSGSSSVDPETSDYTPYASRSAMSPTADFCPTPGDASSTISDTYSNASSDLLSRGGFDQGAVQLVTEQERHQLSKVNELSSECSSMDADADGPDGDKKAVTKDLLECSYGASSAPMSSPQSTVSSSEDSVTCHSEVSMDSLSSTSHAFATMMTVQRSDLDDRQYASSLLLEDEGEAECLSPAAGQALPTDNLSLPDGLSTPPHMACDVMYTTCLESDSLDIRSDHFSAERTAHSSAPAPFESLEVCGTKVSPSIPCHGLVDDDLSNQAFVEREEVLASHSSASEATTQQPNRVVTFQPTDDCPSPNSISVTVMGSLHRCCSCLMDKIEEEVLTHRGCAEIMCRACIERSVAAGILSFACVKCGSQTDVFKDYILLRDNVQEVVDLQLPVVVRHRDRPHDPLHRQFCITGTPFLVKVSSRCDTAELYQAVAKRLAAAGDLIPLSSSRSSSYTISTAAVKSRNAVLHGHFVISLLNSMSLTCSRCISSCAGCVLPRTGYVDLLPLDTLGITFDISLHCQSVDMLQHAEQDPGADEALPDTITLATCLKDFTKVEILGGTDPFDCPHCETKEEAVKSISVSRLPPVLLVQLKRFMYDGSIGEKLDNPVRFSLSDVDFSCLRSSGGASSEVVDVTLSAGDHPSVHSSADGHVSMAGEQFCEELYDVTAFICHTGGLRAGHYTAFVKHPVQSDWYYYNDRSVTKVSPTLTDMDNAYVIVYSQKRNSPVQIPQPTWSTAAFVSCRDSPPPLILGVPPALSTGLDMVGTTSSDDKTRDDLLQVASRLSAGSHRSQPFVAYDANNMNALGGQKDPSPTVSPLDNNSPTSASVTLPNHVSAPADGALTEYGAGYTDFDFMTDEEKIAEATKRSLLEYRPTGSDFGDPSPFGQVASEADTTSNAGEPPERPSRLPNVLDRSAFETAPCVEPWDFPSPKEGSSFYPLVVEGGPVPALVDSTTQGVPCARTRPVPSHFAVSQPHDSIASECPYCLKYYEGDQAVHLDDCTPYRAFVPQGTTDNQHEPETTSVGEELASNMVVIKPDAQLQLYGTPVPLTGSADQQENEEEEEEVKVVIR